jgi:hypothetical protein
MASSSAAQILARIEAIKSLMASGVDGAGYGDKRTDFRSLDELRWILNDLQEQLDEAMGVGRRVRQYRMVTPWDKGL